MKKLQSLKNLIISLILFLICGEYAFAGMQINNRTLHGVSSVNEEYLTTEFLVIDPLGRKAGHDANTGMQFEEFNLGYSNGDNTGFPDEETLPDNVIRDFYVEAMLGKLIDGDYIVEVTGLDGGGRAQYSLSISTNRDVDDKSSNAKFIGIVETGLPVKYIITYSSDPSKPVATAVKFADPAALKRDIAVLYKVGFMDSDGVMNSLMSKANAIEASIAKGNKAAARSQLDALVNELNAQKDKHVAPDAVKILIEDAQYIKDHL